MKESFFKRWPAEVLKRTREFIQRPGGGIVKRPDRHVRGREDGRLVRLDEKNEANKRFRVKNLDRWLNAEAAEGLRTLHLDLATEPTPYIVDLDALSENFYQADQPIATD